MPATTLSSYALTTLASAKRHLRVTTTADDTLITECINAATDKIEQICGRYIMARAFTERYESVAHGRLHLRQYPVNVVYRIMHCLENVVSVSYSGTDIVANVAVTETDVRLRNVSSAGTTTDTTSLLFATYPTTTLLAAAISAVSGWTATAIKSVPSTDLWPNFGHNADDVTTYLEAPTTAVDDYSLDPRLGIMRIAYGTGGRWADMPYIANVSVQYNAGVSTAPDSLCECCNEIAAAYYKEGQMNPNVQSESLGDYSYVRALMSTISIDDRIVKRVSEHARIDV